MRYTNLNAYLAKKTSLLSSINSTVPKTLQKEIASIAGLSRETASRTLTKLKTRGIIIESEIGLKIEDENSLKKRGITY